MSHPDGLPDLFIDRSLGRLTVPRLLRAQGLRITTLAERYGMPDDERVSDVTWLADAGGRGEAVLMKDERVAHNPAELAAVVDHRVRAFCLARKDLTGASTATLFIQHLPAVTRACQDNANGIWVVRQSGLRRLR